VAVSIAIAAALITGGTAVAGSGLVTLLLLLLGCGALIVPVGVVVVLWPQARPLVRVLLGVAGLACLLLLVLGVLRVAAVVPTLL
jgi:hypothetical protein